MIEIAIDKNQILELAELGRAIKQKNFIYFNGMIAGTDFPQSCLIYTNTSFLNSDIEGFVFNYKNLSSCAKLLIGDSVVVFRSIDGFNYVSDNGIECIKNMAIYTVINRNLENTIICNKAQVDITDNIQKLFSLRKGDGGYKFVYNGYCMTLFSGILPLHKSDKVYLTIVEDSPSTFISRFVIKQAKAITVSIILRYLRI